MVHAAWAATPLGCDRGSLTLASVPRQVAICAATRVTHGLPYDMTCHMMCPVAGGYSCSRQAGRPCWARLPCWALH